MTSKDPQYIQEPLFPDSLIVNTVQPEPQPATVPPCDCQAQGQDGDGRVRYQARDGEFVDLPCRNHPPAGDAP